MILTDTSKETVWSLDEYNVFLEAAGNGDAVTVQRLLDRGMDPDTVGPRGWTALRKAAAANRGEVALELLKRGATVDAADYLGQTALMIACSHGHHDMVLLLLFYGADPERKNATGRTPLMLAAANGNARVVGALLDRLPPVDLSPCDRIGKSAVDIAIMNGQRRAAEMLQAAHAARSMRGTAVRLEEEPFFRRHPVRKCA